VIGRRRLLQAGFAVIPVGGLLGQQPVGVRGDSTAAAPQADPLRDPYAVGRLRDTLTAADNDPVIIAIERRLRCTCGCTLDVYTCRTTDFTCTYSPTLHKEVVTLYTAGQTPEQVIDAFVAREGESILMAPPPAGFNLVGYLLPGLVMTAGALGLVAWISRRRAAVVRAATGPSSDASIPDAPLPEPDAAQRERLRRALDQVDS
jgi:cytochrome c-type biogenesis protein CcmH